MIGHSFSRAASHLRSICRLGSAALASNLGELRLPFRCTWILTWKCNLRCAMCGIWRRPPAPVLTLSEIDRFLAGAGFLSWVNLSGGEIFLRPDLEEILELLDRRCPSLYLLNFPTNGSQPDLIEGTVARMLEQRGFPKVLMTVSLDGPPDVHDSIRGKPGAWKAAVETFSRLRRQRSGRYGVFLGMTLQAGNRGLHAATLAAVDREIGGITTGDVHLNVAQNSAHYYGNERLPGARIDVAMQHEMQSELAAILAGHSPKRLDPVDWLERRYQALAADFLKTGRTPVPCQALNASFFLDPTGAVYPCSMFDKPIGNLREAGFDLRALWAGSGRRALRDEIRNESCPHCWTPCEAYQSLLGSLAHGLLGRKGRGA